MKNLEEKTFVEYMTYLGQLMKKEENKGKSEKQLIAEHKLYNKLYKAIKCSSVYRQKLKLPLGTYYIKELTRFRGNISELTDAFDETIMVEVSKKELATLNAPYNAVYEFVSLNDNKHYKRKNENLFLMHALTQEEVYSLDFDYPVENYYIKYSQGPLYKQEISEDNKISLTKIHDPKDYEAGYYICDEDYPEELKEIIIYLETDSDYTFVQRDLPEKKKSFYTRRRRKQN